MLCLPLNVHYKSRIRQRPPGQGLSEVMVLFDRLKFSLSRLVEKGLASDSRLGFRYHEQDLALPFYPAFGDLVVSRLIDIRAL